MSLLDVTLDWDGDVRLIPARIEHPITAHHHAPTGVMAVIYPIKGRWTDDAIHELGRSLQSVLPGRHIGRVMYYGAIRVAVYLGITPDVMGRRHLRFDPENNRDRYDDAPISDTLDRASYALARAVARLEHSDRALSEQTPLPEPSPWALRAFARAEQSMGPQERVPAPDENARKFGDEWGRLHQTAGIDVRDRFTEYNHTVQ